MVVFFKEVESTLANTTPLRRRLALRMLGHGEAENPELSHGDVLFLWLVNLLVQAAPLSDDQLFALLEEYKEHIRTFGNRLNQELTFIEMRREGQESNYKRLLPAGMLSILDRTWVICSGRDDIFDLREGRKIDKLEQAPLESIAYNLTTLYRVSLARMEKHKARKPHEEKSV